MGMFSSEASSEPGVQYSEHTQAENIGSRLPQIGDILTGIRVSFRGDSEHNHRLECDDFKLVHIHRRFRDKRYLTHQARI